MFAESHGILMRAEAPPACTEKVFLTPSARSPKVPSCSEGRFVH